MQSHSRASRVKQVVIDGYHRLGPDGPADLVLLSDGWHFPSYAGNRQPPVRIAPWGVGNCTAPNFRCVECRDLTRFTSRRGLLLRLDLLPYQEGPE